MERNDNQELQRRPRWLALILLLIVVVVVAGGMLVLPRVPEVKRWRASRLAEEAEKAMAAAEWATAQRKVIAACQLAPDQAGSLRAAARLNAAAGMPEALIFFKRLMKTGQATDADAIAYAEVLLRFGSYQLFLDVIGGLPQKVAGDVRVALLLASYAVICGDAPSAMKYLRQVLSAPTASTVQRTDAALMMLNLPDAAARRSGAEFLLGEARRVPSQAKRLIAAVLAAPETSDDLRDQAAEALKLLPGHPFDGRVEGAYATIRLHPDQKQELLAGLIRDAKTPEEKRDVASLMVRLGENKKVLDFLRPSEARARRDLFLVWLDAKAGLGQWDDILNVLRSGPTPLEPAIRDLYSGRCNEALGQDAPAAAFFERAARAPTEDREMLFYLAGYFSQMGKVSMAEIVLGRLTLDALAGRRAFEGLVNIYRNRNDTKKLAETLEDMARRWPKDTAVQNDRNYLQLLQGKDVASSLEKSRKLLGAHPDIFPLRMTYALALMRVDKPAEALQLFGDSPVQLMQLLPQQRALFAALLAANGRMAEARTIGATVAEGRLLPEERKFLPK